MQRIEHLEAAACPELNIEIEHLRRQPSDGLDGGVDRIGFRRHLEIIELADEAPELRARRWFIVDDDDRMTHPVMGNSIVATVPREKRDARLNS